MTDLDTMTGIFEKIVTPFFKYAVPRLGKVVDRDDKEGRVLVQIPSLGWDTNDKGAWCFPTDKKSLMVPEIGDFVLVEWVDQNPDIPIYRGISGNMKDQIPENYDGDPKTNILFEGSSDDIIKYKEGTLEIISKEILLGNNPSKGVARNGDSIKSTPADDSIFWAWLSAAAVVLAGLGVVAPTPTSLTGKITSGSSNVKAGD